MQEACKSRCWTAWQKAQYDTPLRVPNSTNRDGRNTPTRYIANGTCCVQADKATRLGLRKHIEVSPGSSFDKWSRLQEDPSDALRHAHQPKTSACSSGNPRLSFSESTGSCPASSGHSIPTLASLQSSERSHCGA